MDPTRATSARLGQPLTPTPHIDAADIAPNPLPPYSPSGATPAYSCSPHADEQRLAISTRGRRGHALPAAARTGVFRAAGRRAGIALVLHNQEADAEGGGGVRIPSFGRDARVAGTVELASSEGVARAEVELAGHLKLTIAEGGRKTRRLFRTAYTLWQKAGASPHAQAQACPRTLDFVVPMPSAFVDTMGVARPLPPSYQVIFPGVPGLLADSVYSITVRVRRARKVLWAHTDSISTPIKYYPRTRAPRAIMKHTLSFFSLLKIAPEEFRQVESTMQTRLGSGFAPIHCLLFIPSACIYAITDEIPFHLQLVAPLTSLVAFCAPHVLSGGSRTSAIAQLQSSLHPAVPLASTLLLAGGAAAAGQASAQQQHANCGIAPSVLSGGSRSASLLHNLGALSSTARGPMPGARAPRRPTVRVFLLRQITVEVRGQRAWRTFVLGEGCVEPCPPGVDDAGRARAHRYPYPRSATATAAAADAADPLEALNWTGTVRVASRAGRRVGGFAAGALGLVVKDFVVLALAPPDPARSPLVEHQHAHPIRLVTDPVAEDVDGDVEAGGQLVG